MRGETRPIFFMEKVSMNRSRTLLFVLSLLIAASLVLTACTGGQTVAPASTGGEQPASSPAETVELRYMLWDANQLPAYQACATNFTAKNPNIKIKIEQLGWNDYWQTLQTEMVAGTAADVFTNVTSKYPEFASKNQLVDIESLVQRDNVDLSIYLGSLTENWVKDGKRYGLPKDWDTIAIVYNTQRLEEGGVSVEELDNATWNPTDGGTFEQIIAKLTVDQNGKNGLDPSFDKTKIERYGFIIDGLASPFGNVSWANFSGSMGWNYVDGPWTTKYYYDDPKMVQTLDWIYRMMEKGYVAPAMDVKSLGGPAMFSADKGALTINGSWMIGWFKTNSNFDFGFARLPEGPNGHRSVFNGLADSIWSGSKHKDEAWLWMKYLASPDCLNVVGQHAVVFPAVQSGVDEALKAFDAKGLDVSAFTDLAKPETTLLLPITEHGSEINSIMEAGIDAIFAGQVSVEQGLKEANQKVNDLFK
jgi:multiple sugar transport system substrate-binding protein